MDAEPFFRVTKGQPDAAELAAVTAVLALLPNTSGDAPPERRPGRAPWRRPERARNPRSWREA